MERCQERRRRGWLREHWRRTNVKVEEGGEGGGREVEEEGVVIKRSREASEEEETYDLSPAFSRVSSSRLLDLLTVWRTWSTTSEPCRQRSSW